jgi:hypothetical protein
VSERWHRDRIIGAVLVAIGVIGLLGTLVTGWATGPRAVDRIRVEAPPAGDQDGTQDDSDGIPDWMGRMRDRMPGGRPGGEMPGFGPGSRGPGAWGGGQGDGWMGPDQGGRGWHRGPGAGTPDASPTPSPSESPSPSETPSTSPTSGQG